MAAAGLALVLAHGDEGSLRAALSLALAAVTVGDDALVFASQAGLALLAVELPSAELAELRDLATAEGVRWVACADSLTTWPGAAQALMPGVELAGAARFDLAARSAAVSLYL